MTVHTATTKPTVYVETSVLSYYTARPSRDVIVIGHQEITRRWWERAPKRFELVVSELVVLEAKGGDPEASERRLGAIKAMPTLLITPRHSDIADRYMAELPLPEKAARDAMHLALASAEDVDYLVTWNCAHIANALIWRNLARINEALGLSTPIVCTPEELLGEEL